MIISDKIKIGNRISMESVKASKSQEKRIYQSRVLDVLDDYTYDIAIPMEHGHIVPLEKGRRFEVIYYTDTGLFQNECSIKDRYQKNQIYMLCMDSMTRLVKIQRREYFRLPCDIVMKYHNLDVKEKFLLDRLHSAESLNSLEEGMIKKELMIIRRENPWKEGQVADISGGGVRFKNNELLEKGQAIRMQLNMQLPGTKGIVELNGIVVESNHQLDNVYEQRVKFDDIEDNMREAIIKFIFDEQLRLRNQ